LVWHEFSFRKRRLKNSKYIVGEVKRPFKRKDAQQRFVPERERKASQKNSKRAGSRRLNLKLGEDGEPVKEKAIGSHYGEMTVGKGLAEGRKGIAL